MLFSPKWSTPGLVGPGTCLLTDGLPTHARAHAHTHTLTYTHTPSDLHQHEHRPTTTTVPHSHIHDTYMQTHTHRHTHMLTRIEIHTDVSTHYILTEARTHIHTCSENTHRCTDTPTKLYKRGHTDAQIP